MTATLMDANGIDVTRYVGVTREDGGNRSRFQITNRAMGEYVSLSWEQLTALITWIAGTDAVELLTGPSTE